MFVRGEGRGHTAPINTSPVPHDDVDDDNDDGFILAVGDSDGDTVDASPRVAPTAEWVAMVMMETNDHFTAFRTDHPAAAVPRVSLSFKVRASRASSR